MVFQKKLTDFLLEKEKSKKVVEENKMTVDSNSAMRSYESKLNLTKSAIKRVCMLNHLCFKLVDEGKIKYETAYNIIMKAENDMSIIECFLAENGVVLSAYNHETYFKNPEPEKKEKKKKNTGAESEKIF